MLQLLRFWGDMRETKSMLRHYETELSFLGARGEML